MKIPQPDTTTTPTRSYVAQLDQSGTNDPIATVFKNTLGDEITWTRNNTGITFGNTTKNVFPEGKTIYRAISNNFYTSNGIIAYWQNNPSEENAIRFDIIDTSGAHQDTYQVWIEIITH